MKTNKQILVNANEAVAQIAYKTNEIFPIYPITPASTMSELVEEWSAKQHKNIFGHVPTVIEMQSESGVAGTMHGALQTGSLSTTFTASQGLLLMMPNMYKIAGELTPNVIHVATRSVATHALSIFGDHSDVMAIRNSGYAFLASASVQEAMDFALIAQAATLSSRIPFVHFFDGFRTSHESQLICNISDKDILEMMGEEAIQNHRLLALRPEKPVIRGTSQAADTFFQSREASNKYYDRCPNLVQQTMDQFAQITGRQYRLFEYIGHPEAEQLIITMASSSETVIETVEHLNSLGGKFGCIAVKLYRPFSKKHLLQALPKTCRKIAVLDRAKEPGSSGEPLFLDIVQTLTEAFQNDEIPHLPYIVGGRYGLSSKEFTPTMVQSIFKNFQADQPINDFTIGIKDNVTFKSLALGHYLEVQQKSFQALVYGFKSQDLQSAHQQFLNSFNGKESLFLQSYTEIDYKKSNSRNVHNIRFSKQKIRAPYLVELANLVVCESPRFVVEDNFLERICDYGTLVVFSESQKDLWSELPASVKNKINTKNISLYAANGSVITIFDIMGAFNPFFTGEADVRYLERLDTIKQNGSKPWCNDLAFNTTFLGKLIAGEGNSIPVGDFPVDGTYPSGTSALIGDRNKGILPVWNPEECTQCGLCSISCPQSALRIKAYTEIDSPVEVALKKMKAIHLGSNFEQYNYTIQINPDQCTSCNLCVDACDTNALQMVKKEGLMAVENENWKAFRNIPEFDRTLIEVTNLSQQQLQEPLFKYSLGEDGCAQAPYLKIMTQLFGDRMLIANATGASSIFGGALPVTPWSKNSEGHGPAWSNSLFEDNAEFGLGFLLSQQQLQKQAKSLLKELRNDIDVEVIPQLLNNDQNSEAKIKRQRNNIEALKLELTASQNPMAKQLATMADYLVKRSVWVVGGDGWAYDIGFAGLDHVLASGENINILVLDNELYSNTGGQQSKATPMGASSKFGFAGKTKQKKNLGAMAMNYDGVYVASVALGADAKQTLKVFIEAESFDGPSLIIAYCHSPEHGIDVTSPSKHQKMAVASGHWPLYRNDPRNAEKGMPLFQLDSEFPSKSITSFFEMENRFAGTLSDNYDMIESIQRKIEQEFEAYQSKTGGILL